MIIERVKVGGRGQGSLVKYDNSPHWVSCFYVHGKEHRVSTGTPDLKVARRFHKAKLDEVSADRQGLRKFAAPVAQRVTVAELLDDWEKDVKLRGLKSSYKAVAHSKPIRAHFGSWKAVDVTAEAVDRYVEKLRTEGLAAATCNRRVQCLASAFKLGLARKRLIHVPAFRKLSEAGNARRGFFERDEVERLVAVIPEHLADLTRFAFLTGWRKAEIVGLRWEMVDLAGGTITLPTTKNGKGRVLALDGPVAEVDPSPGGRAPH